PEHEYSAFLGYEAMRRKYDYFHQFDISTVEDLLLNLAVFGAFIEGVSLFSSFAILMNFPRLGKLKGVGQIVTWSVRDESLHSNGVCRLFRDLMKENQILWTPQLRARITDACQEMVALEDAFVDSCFAAGPVPGLTPEEIKQYIRYTADKKLIELRLDKMYHVGNSLPWLDVMINAKEHTNFFENRATEYAKGAVVIDWEVITSSIT
ncbi:MAG: ribonucleotide-diphosphate reductase subunit beta, partial [Patescibacteria group bacterium]